MGFAREVSVDPAAAAAPDALRPVPCDRRPVTRQSLLRLQQTVGNRAVGRMLASASDSRQGVGGLDPDAPEPEEVDEMTEPVGGIAVKAAEPTLARNGGGATTTPALNISVYRESAPTWGANGAFDWRVSFRTTGRSGWIVQEVINSVEVKDAAGSAVNTSGVVPHYWEAWAVDGSGKITPSAGKVHDMWIRPNWGANTKGSWSMSGRLFFTTTDPATQGFTPGGVSNAGILLSSATKPTGLGRVLRWRLARGSWDSTAVPARAHRGRAV